MNKHTQTPWTCELHPSPGVFIVPEAAAHEKSACNDLDSLAIADGIAEANAEFIVKACNEYDTTRRLLKEALDAIELGFQFDDGDVYGMQHNDITDLAIEIEQILTV